MSTPREVCVLVDDQESARTWLETAITRAFPEIEIATAASLSRARSLLDDLEARGSPLRLALVDLGLPDGSGVELIRRLAERQPQVLTIVVTIFDDDDHLFGALRAGARGYLLKGDDADVIAHYLRRISAGEPPLSPSIARRILHHFHVPVPPASAPEEPRLTPRETEILTLLAKGLTVNEVARMLGPTSQTIAGYVKDIYRKLNVSSRAEATLEAVKRGLT